MRPRHLSPWLKKKRDGVVVVRDCVMAIVAGKVLPSVAVCAAAGVPKVQKAEAGQADLPDRVGPK